MPDQISIRTRSAGHVPSPEDLVDFADHVFFGRPLPDGFGELAYPVDEDAYGWSAPP